MAKSQSEQQKEQGNAALKKGSAAEAVLHYTHAVKLDPNNHLLYSNRALAFLRMDQLYLALQDANMVIKMQPSWPKGYFRKGEVEFKAGQYQLALMSYKQALLLDPTDDTLAAAISKTNKEMARERKVLNRQPYLFTGGGVAVGMLVVMADYFLTDTPSVQHPVIQVLLISAFAAIGFGILKAYRYLVDSQTASLLEPPPDLLGEMNGKSSSEANGGHRGESDAASAQNTHSHRKGGTASARQRYRKAKS